MWVSVHECRCPEKAEEGIGYPGSGAPGSCELPVVGAGNWSQVPWKTMLVFNRLAISLVLSSGWFFYPLSYQIDLHGPLVTLPHCHCGFLAMNSQNSTLSLSRPELHKNNFSTPTCVVSCFKINVGCHCQFLSVAVFVVIKC